MCVWSVPYVILLHHLFRFRDRYDRLWQKLNRSVTSNLSPSGTYNSKTGYRRNLYFKTMKKGSSVIARGEWKHYQDVKHCWSVRTQSSLMSEPPHKWTFLRIRHVLIITVGVQVLQVYPQDKNGLTLFECLQPSCRLHLVLVVPQQFWCLYAQSMMSWVWFGLNEETF